MIRAIIEGEKWQTRRTINRHYGEIGDRLWVRETWMPDPYINSAASTIYRATEPELEKYSGHAWKPSIFMPRIRSRITLEIQSVRVEPLQDISEEDAIAEGCSITERAEGNYFNGGRHPVKGVPKVFACARAAYHDLWDSINCKKHPWISNPMVWVIQFRRI